MTHVLYLVHNVGASREWIEWCSNILHLALVELHEVAHLGDETSTDKVGLFTVTKPTRDFIR